MSKHFRPTGALTFVVVGSLLLALGIATPASAVDYPSWTDVQNARQNQAATAATITKIEGIVVSLQNDAAALGLTAQRAAEGYNSAKVSLDAATARNAGLQAQAAEAKQRAAESKARAGLLVAQLARTGGGSISLELLVGPGSKNLLNSLGMMSKLTAQSSAIYEQAVLDGNQARSLADQATIAETKRKALAASAQQAFATATTASDAAVAKVNEQQAVVGQLYAQLATLKGTTVAVEANYQAGLTAAAELAAQPPPPPPPSNPPNPPPALPNTSAVDGALAFATAQIGKTYQLAGAGPDVWDCSGLTQAAYAAVGVYIGEHTATGQYLTMSERGRLVPLANMVPGDLIFYGVPSDVYHVAIYAGNGQMIEAARYGIPIRITGVRYFEVLPYAGRPTG